jgi:hypothetical protein
MVRWAIEAAVILLIVSFGAFRVFHDRPGSLVSLAVPSLIVVVVATLAWPRMVAAASRRDSWGALFSLSAVASIAAYVASLASLAVLSGALFSDPGEQGGAVLMIGGFLSLLPAFLGVPLAILLPRIVDPGLRPNPGLPAT